jgi:hypothetical protein
MVSQPQSSARASSNQAKPYVMVAKIIHVVRESQRMETVVIDNLKFTKALGFAPEWQQRIFVNLCCSTDNGGRKRQ